MKGIFARGHTQRPVSVVARECELADGSGVDVGDLVTVRALDRDVIFSIRLTGPGADPESWRGTVFQIACGEESVVYAEGLEVDDIVEITRREMVEVIKHHARSAGASVATTKPGTSGTLS